MSVTAAFTRPSRPDRGAQGGEARRAAEAPRRVRETVDPAVDALLAGATVLPPLPEPALATVARALAEAGHVVLVRYGAGGGRLVYFTRERAAAGGAGAAGAPAAEERAGGDRPPAAPTPGDRAGGARAGDWGTFEGEGSQRLSAGSVRVSDEAWWSASLAVPAVDPGTALVALRRHGPAAPGYRGDPSAELVLPLREVSRVATLLDGLVGQALRDGVLPAPGADGAG